MRISDWSADVCSSDLFQRPRHHVTDDDDVPRIWVDADACPGVIKDILFRAAERTRVRVTLVANQWLRTPPSRFIDAIQVPGGFDVADSAIVEQIGRAHV